LHEQREPYINYDFFKAFKNLDGEETATDVQMDVDEFRNMLFDRIESLLPKEYNFMPKIFNGKLASVIKSLECEHQSTR
jgi:ubiquitin carboxyl-terminal hydrolase 34